MIAYHRIISQLPSPEDMRGVILVRYYVEIHGSIFVEIFEHGCSDCRCMYLPTTYRVVSKKLGLMHRYHAR